jgi:phage-related protein
MGAGFSKFGRALEKDVGFRVDKAHNGLALLSNFVGGPFGQALMVGVVASDTISTALSIVSVENLKAAASWVKHKVALVATTIATWAQTIAMRALGIAMMVATGPIGLIILGIAALAVGLVIAYKKSETFRKIVDAVFRAVWGTIKIVWNWIKNNWPLLLGILTGPIGLATILIIKNWKKIIDGVKSMVSAIKGFFTRLPGQIIGWVGALGRLLYNKGRDLLDGLWNGIKNVWLSVSRWIRDLDQKILTALGTLANTLYYRGRNLLNGLWRGIKGVWSGVISWFKGLPKQILSALGIASPPQWAIDAGRHIMAGILKGVVPGGKELLQFAKDTVASLQAGFGGGGLLGRILAGGGGTGAGGSAVQIGQRMAESVGWGGSQWQALYLLWQNESGWNPLADNPTSTAFGIPQFLASTARQYGVYGSTDPARQIAAGLQYISDVYGNPINAWNAWRSRSPHWYDQGGVASGAGFFGKRTLQPERVLSPAQTRSFDRLVRVLDRGGSAGIINVTVNTGGVVGMTKMDLENALVATLNRVAGQGRLDRAVRVAAR